MEIMIDLVASDRFRTPSVSVLHKLSISQGNMKKLSNTVDATARIIQK
jgi:hypothetical protein